MPSRRHFLAASSAALLAPSMLAAHSTPPRGILRLNLKTSKLPELRAFYSGKLQLPVDGTAGTLSIRAGSTTIDFSHESGDPYYHFAFNIPENKLASSKRWLASRGIEILKRPDGRDEYHFESWNAHAVYFLDPAGNILEFIARHNLKNFASGDFTPADILYASEIGIVVDDVKHAAAAAKSSLNLDPFANPPGDAFAAVGDDHRLLIIINRNRPWNIGAARAASVFPTTAALAGPESRSLKLPDFPYSLTTATS
jgi:catechol-2,3-dioxygenase